MKISQFHFMDDGIYADGVKLECKEDTGMKVYRDVDGMPVLAGECSLQWQLGGWFPEYIQTERPIAGGLITMDKWKTGLVGAPRSSSIDYEYVIKLRPEDNPENLPGWTMIPTYRGTPIHVVDDVLLAKTPEALPCRSCGKPLDHTGPSAFCVACQAQLPVATELVVRDLDETQKRIATEFKEAISRDLVEHDWKHKVRVTNMTDEELREAGRKPLLAEAEELIVRDLEETQKRIAAECEATLRDWENAFLEGMRRALYGGDSDGPLVPLPQKPQPEEKPYIPQKFGEHD